ncbi:MAG: hypothetical protein PF440_01370 [Thiomicrorhabdus sp.]|jgi:hypothetical protein|nr:hypothetical protein [Thiomicrorhabdus sp.]
MQQKMFKDKYPIFSLEFSKAESKFATTPAIIEYLHGLIEADPKAVNIAIFDHYTHTKSVDGVINPEISDAQNIIFCFGWELPSADPVAVRPRSFGVTEFNDKFIVNFMEAPNPVAQEMMVTWVNSLVK